jgi:hypothetical protein
MVTLRVIIHILHKVYHVDFFHLLNPLVLQHSQRLTTLYDIHTDDSKLLSHLKFYSIC